MNIQKFTQKSIEAVQNCEKVAVEYGNQEIEQEHLLYSLMTIEDSLIAKLVERMGVDTRSFIMRIEEAIAKRTKVSGGQPYIACTTSKPAAPPTKTSNECCTNTTGTMKP